MSSMPTSSLSSSSSSTGCACFTDAAKICPTTVFEKNINSLKEAVGYLQGKYQFKTIYQKTGETKFFRFEPFSAKPVTIGEDGTISGTGKNKRGTEFRLIKTSTVELEANGQVKGGASDIVCNETMFLRNTVLRLNELAKGAFTLLVDGKETDKEEEKNINWITGPVTIMRSCELTNDEEEMASTLVELLNANAVPIKG